MIKSFKHKGLEIFFTKDDLRLLDRKQIPRIRRVLDLLDIIKDVQELNLPGYGLHPLTGDRKGTWSIKVSANWRITFELEKSHAINVNLEDYH